VKANIKKIILSFTILFMNNIYAQTLTGILSPDFIAELNDAHEWTEHMKNYQPKTEALETIKQHAGNYDLIIVLGTWCSDSKMYFPYFQKILNLTNVQFKSIKIIGVDESKQSDLEGYDKLNIGYVPTFIILKQGIEIARIVENPLLSLEEDIASAMLKN